MASTTASGVAICPIWHRSSLSSGRSLLVCCYVGQRLTRTGWSECWSCLVRMLCSSKRLGFVSRLDQLADLEKSTNKMIWTIYRSMKHYGM